jgi:hypothetical protein
MAKCIVCNETIKGEKICLRCKVVAEGLLGNIIWQIPKGYAKTRFDNIMKPVKGKRNDVRMRHLVKEFRNSSDMTWAILSENCLSIKEKNNLLQSWKTMYDAWGESGPSINHFSYESNHEDPLQILANGTSLYGGKKLRFISGDWSIGGRKLPGTFPAAVVLKAMTKKYPKGLCPSRFDWAKLIPAISALCSNEDLSPTARSFMQMANEIQRGGRQLNNLINHHAPRSLYQLPIPSYEMNWFIWQNPLEAETMRRELFEKLMQMDPRWLRRYRAGRFNIPDFQIDASQWPNPEMPWSKRWKEVGKITVSDKEKESPFAVRQNRFMIRVVNSHSKRKREGVLHWKRVKMMEDPRLWALIASWGLSPIGHRSREFLSCLRWNWGEISTEIAIDKADQRALNLLADICRSNSKHVYVDGRKIIVKGKSGCIYAVNAGRGAHGAPFTINAWHSEEDLKKKRSSHPLCIHSGPPSKMPLGDIISSVVLTLLDDNTSCERIKSLFDYIHNDGRNRGGARDHYRNRMDRELLRHHNREIEPRFQYINHPHRVEENNIYNIIGRNRNIIAANADNADNVDIDADAGGGVALVNQEVGEGPDPANQNAENIVNNPPYQDLGHLLRPFVVDPDHPDPLEGARIAVENARGALRNEEIQRNIDALQELEQAGRAVCGRAGLRTPRWATLFPLFSRLMQSLPFESSMRIPTNQGELISFEDCGFQMNLRNDDEMEFAKLLATTMGWRIAEEDNGGDGGENELWRRRSAPVGDALTQISNHLRPLQDRLGLRAEEPWWWAYRQINAEMPDAPEINWEMELSYADVVGQQDYFVE